MKYIIWYLGSFVSFLVIDLTWLGVVAVNFYNAKLKDLKATEVNWPAAFLFYLLFVAGLLYFVVHPALMEKNLKMAATNGALLGFFAYMTYDLTNLAVIRNWPLDMSIVDIAWGTVLGSLVCTISYLIGNKVL